VGKLLQDLYQLFTKLRSSIQENKQMPQAMRYHHIYVRSLTCDYSQFITGDGSALHKQKCSPWSVHIRIQQRNSCTPARQRKRKV
jgi:hypothetical protein